jgi:hypothetical protein
VASNEFGISFDDAGGPVPAPGAPAAGPNDLGLNFEDAGGYVPPSAAARAPSAAANWGPGLHFLDAMLMGYGPHLAAMAPRAAGMESVAAGGPGGGRSAEAELREAQTRERLEAARAAWAKEHPAAAVGTELAGTAVPALGALVGQEYALAPLGAALSRLGPHAARIINALRGTAGAEQAGMAGRAVRTGFRALRGGIEGAESTAAEKGIKGQPITLGDIAEGAAIGGTLNPLMRGVMPRAREMGPAEAMLRSAEGQPMHHQSQVGHHAQELVRRGLSEARGSPISAGILGLLGAEAGPSVYKLGAEMLPGGAGTAAAATLPAVASAIANRIMASPGYQDRIARAAMRGGDFAYSRTNPLIPFATTPLLGEERAAGGPVGYARGGSPARGGAYVIGEGGPELFVPHVPGTVIPNKELRRLVAKYQGKGYGSTRQGGGAVTVQQGNNWPGYGPPQTATDQTAAAPMLQQAEPQVPQVPQNQFAGVVGPQANIGLMAGGSPGWASGNTAVPLPPPIAPANAWPMVQPQAPGLMPGPQAGIGLMPGPQAPGFGGNNEGGLFGYIGRPDAWQPNVFGPRAV